MYKLIVLAGMLAVSGQAMAAKLSTEELAEKGFTGEAELGFSSSYGNTEESSLRGRAAFEYVLLDWRHSTEFRAKNVQDDEKTKAENYFGSYKIDRNWSAERYTFAQISYEDDRFKSKEDLVVLGLGYGQKFNPAKDVIIDTTVGPGYSWNQYEEGTKEWVLVGAAKLDWKLSKTSKFVQKLSAKAGQNNTSSRSESSLTTNIIGALAMKLSLILEHQTQPGFKNDGTEKKKLDRVSAITLLYSF